MGEPPCDSGPCVSWRDDRTAARFRLSPFMIFNSGSPYNVTVGQRRAIPSLTFAQRRNRPAGGVPISTAACHYTFSTTPGQSYAQIPINYLTGPSNFTLNLRLAKTFGFGPETSKNGAHRWWSRRWRRARRRRWR